MQDTADKSISAAEAWLLAARPKTLIASIVPVAIGATLAVAENSFQISTGAAIVLAALLIQIGCNFANDAIDFERGTDTADRLGPTRAVQAGFLSGRTMKIGAALTLSLATLIGLYLVRLGGLPILLIGTAAVISAVLYSAGPYALAYTGLGEIFVLIFFGPAAVAGTFYLFTGRVTSIAILAGVACGAISTALLAVNNLRDIQSDFKSAKRTLAVRFGKTFARYEYISLLLLAACCPIAVAVAEPQRAWTVLSSLYLLAAIKPMRTVLSGANGGPELNLVLERTAKLLALFGVMFCASYLLKSK